ncbi:MAG: DUF2283 domain-containing protein [Caldilineaceae bacterium]|nr:DUF2283 domain-containing protein [Caldilineaceae bacterium]
MQMVYFEQEDTLHLTISDEPEKGSMELSPNITAELNDDCELIGLEIVNAGAFILDTVVKSFQAKMLSFAKAEKQTKIVERPVITPCERAMTGSHSLPARTFQPVLATGWSRRASLQIRIKKCYASQSSNTTPK